MAVDVVASLQRVGGDVVASFQFPVAVVASGGRRRKRRNSLVGFQPPIVQRPIPAHVAACNPVGDLFVVDPMPRRPAKDLAPGLRYQPAEQPTPAPSIVIVPVEIAAKQRATVPPPAPMPTPNTHGPEIAALRRALQQRLLTVDKKLEELATLIAEAQADQARRVDEVAATVEKVADKQKKLAIALENQRRAAILMREFLDPV